MKDFRTYTISFFKGFSLLLCVFLIFTHWMNPDRITPAPWSTNLITDRNTPYKKFSLLKNNTSYSDLIVGSSTSEVFVPQMIEELFGVKTYLGGSGGAKTPYKYAQIHSAIQNNPNLKRIIYVADLFEFETTKLDTNVYYQNEIMAEIDPELRNQIPMPDWVSRVQDYISYSTLEKDFKTLIDFIKNKRGHYKSQHRADGSLDKSMVIFNSQEPINSRVLRIAKAYEPIYNSMKNLDPVVMQFVEQILKTATQNNIEVVIVIAPWHPLFYKHFEAQLTKNNDIYIQFISYLRSLASSNVRVLDYSYPTALQKGITEDEQYWHDGVHFSHEAAKIILQELYL